MEINEYLGTVEDANVKDQLIVGAGAFIVDFVTEKLGFGLLSKTGKVAHKELLELGRLKLAGNTDGVVRHLTRTFGKAAAQAFVTEGTEEVIADYGKYLLSRGYGPMQEWRPEQSTEELISQAKETFLIAGITGPVAGGASIAGNTYRQNRNASEIADDPNALAKLEKQVELDEAKTEEEKRQKVLVHLTR